jgi:hypothetical protein
MTATATQRDPVVFSPALWAEDAEANHWMRQATLRLRRETCWRWHLSSKDSGSGSSNRVIESLDLTRYQDEKRAFFDGDVTARYLSEQLRITSWSGEREPRRGGFGWVAKQLQLDEVSRFALGLALVAGFDGAAGPVIAGCLNDATRTQPTLALVQRLWDRPGEVPSLADPAHPLWRIGLLQQPLQAGQPGAGVDWDGPVACPPLVAQRLLSPDTPWPVVFVPIAPGLELEGLNPSVVAERLRAARASLRVVPLRGRSGAPYGEVARAISAIHGREVRRLDVDAVAHGQEPDGYFKSLATLAWLGGIDLLVEGLRPREHPAASPLGVHRAIPVTVFLPVTSLADLQGIPRDAVLPVVDIPSLTHVGRIRCWTHHLGRRAQGLEPAIAHIARRFRYEPETIGSICEGLTAKTGRLTTEALAAACRAQVPLDAGDLAQVVVPRFDDSELVLPPAQRCQFEEIHQAMRWLTEVHYGWGTARAWKDSGISVLFAGPPGTGKTMAAEVLATRLAMPMYRIDLSQVVNKYIGETEKNLKRLFDMADIADAILFFDEADALFGRRTEVRDAHDRYANLEISYLLERMERFKGLAILATNRKRDFDEAMLRRLRFVVDFPMPGQPERLRIWRSVVPEGVDASALDFAFLAQRFPLAGGHIRSIVFHACLQSAAHGAARVLTMPAIVRAIQREYDKLDRAMSLEQFGAYASLVAEEMKV